MTKKELWAVVLVATTAGCARTAPADRVGPAALHGGETPTEVGCPYTEPPDPSRAPYKVSLMYRVTAEGRVDPASIVVRRSTHMTDLEEYVSRAREVAARCVYEPAVVGGEPVEAMVRRIFYFAG